MSKAKYYIYRNLHNDSFSIKYKGLVIKRPRFIILEEVQFKVSETGRQRVLREKRKNVHAILAASNYKITTKKTEEEIEKMLKKDYEEVYYNPYKTKTFILKKNNKKIEKKDKVICFNNRIYIKKLSSI